MDYYNDQLPSTLGFWMCFFIIHGGILLLSLMILINKLWKRRTMIGPGEERVAAAPPDLVSSADHTPSSSTNGRSYEVFLSFRGSDTRYNFTDHLYTALVDAGIHTFIDDNEMRMGEEIKTELLTAIEQSKISIPVFSTNYADSKWCLIELTKMVECREKLNQFVLPIFYDVEPSDVRYQRGTYAKAFRKHQKRVDKKTMEEWREALKAAGSLKGHNVKNRHETKLIKSVVTMVLSELKKTSLVTTDYLVGIMHPVKEMLNLLDVSSMEVRIVGIHGMGGIGKTTIAKAVYNEISCHFENYCFIEDVRETNQQHKGLVQLQKQLISNILKLKDVDITSVDEGVNMIKQRCCDKKVLIVLDDVDNLNQLRALANKRDWFGLGSRIIITTRDKDILKTDVVDEVYIPSELSHYQSLKLFSMHAFRRDRPLDEYYDLSSAIVHTTGGLPLALEVLGSHLSGKGKVVWEDALRKLTKIPHEEVQKRLRISYDELDSDQKLIFLDIACFFIGMNKRIATYVWEDNYPQYGIDILLLRSLVKIGNKNELSMHNQLRDLGREIVRGENSADPGERSRLWIHDEARQVLKSHMGTRKVQGLCLDFRRELRDKEFDEMSELGNESEENCLRNREFAEMSGLRLLRIDYAIIDGDFKHLLSKLRWLSWKGCPHNFTATNFHPEKLIVLDLSRSKVREDWEGWKQIKMAKRLKFINLSGCNELIKTPDFSPFPSLEELILKGCRSLVEIHPSIGCLKCLVFLNVKNCQSLMDIPISICGLSSLESLIVSGCIKLNKLPTGLESLKALKVLHIDGTPMEQFPDPIELPKKLEVLSVMKCPFFTVLPTSIGHLSFLTDLALDGTQIVMLPDSIGSLSKLQHLSLRDCSSLRKIPDSIGQLESLVNLNFRGAGVTEMPDSIGHLRFLTDFALDGTQLVMLPDSIGSLSNLRNLSLSHCRSLRKIPDSIGQLESLVDFNLEGAGVTAIPDSIGHLKSLRTFCLDRTQIVELPDSVGLLVKLERLSLHHCTSLRKIPDSIGQLESLVELDLYRLKRVINASIGFPEYDERRHPIACNDVIGGTEIVVSLDSIGSLFKLHELSLGIGRSLRKFPDSIGQLESLVHLRLYGARVIEIPYSIGSLRMLEYLSLENCGSLRRIPDSIGRLESLIYLNLVRTGIIEISDAIGELKSLAVLDLRDTQIIELPDSIGSLSKLKKLRLEQCGSLRRIPDSIGRLESLHSLDLTRSGTNEIPDAIGELKSLKCLFLEGTQIIELPYSIGLLSTLQILSLRKCGSLRRIPDSIGRLESLRWLDLSGSGIIEIPDAIGELKSLSSLELDKTQIIELPDSMGSLLMLRILSLRNCGSLRRIPDTVGSLSGLKWLHLDDTKITELPDSIGSLSQLRRLSLDGTQITELPDSIGSLSTLGCLTMMHCRLLRKIPDSIGRLTSLRTLELDTTGIMDITNVNATGNQGNLKYLRVDKSGMDAWDCRIAGGEIPIDIGKLLPHSLTQLTLETENSFILPESISNLPIHILSIRNCRNRPSLPHLPSTLSSLHISGCAMETLSNFSNLTNLSTLSICDCENLLEIQSFSALPKLERLYISNCKKLQCFLKQTEIQGLERMKYLRSLDLSGCRSIERLPNMSIMKGLWTLILRNCEKLCDIEGLERLEHLESLDVSGCISLERLPNLSNLKNLKKLWISNCKQLIKIQGIKEGMHLYGRTTGSRYVKIKSATGVEHLKDEKFIEDQGIKRLRLRSQEKELEKDRSIKRLRIPGNTI